MRAQPRAAQRWSLAGNGNLLMEQVFQNLVERLTRQGLNEAVIRFSQAKSAFDRSDWGAANAQIRSALESLFNSVARLRLNTSKTDGASEARTGICRASAGKRSEVRARIYDRRRGYGLADWRGKLG